MSGWSDRFLHHKATYSACMPAAAMLINTRTGCWTVGYGAPRIQAHPRPSVPRRVVFDPIHGDFHARARLHVAAGGAPAVRNSRLDHGTPDAKDTDPGWPGSVWECAAFIVPESRSGAQRGPQVSGPSATDRLRPVRCPRPCGRARHPGASALPPSGLCDGTRPGAVAPRTRRVPHAVQAMS